MLALSISASVYGRAMRERGFLLAGARILKRVWQLYVAHVFLFVIFVAEIAYVSRTFDNPLMTPLPSMILLVCFIGSQ